METIVPTVLLVCVSGEDVKGADFLASFAKSLFFGLSFARLKPSVVAITALGWVVEAANMFRMFHISLDLIACRMELRA